MTNHRQFAAVLVLCLIGSPSAFAAAKKKRKPPKKPPVAEQPVTPPAAPAETPAAPLPPDVAAPAETPAPEASPAAGVEGGDKAEATPAAGGEGTPPSPTPAAGTDASGPGALAPDTSAGAPPPAPETPPTPTPTPAPTPTPPPPASAPIDEAESTRIRFGVSGGLGTFIPGPMACFGLDARVGAQLGSLFGVYGILGYDAGLWLKAKASSSGASVGASAVGLTYVGAVAEATLGDTFFVGAGPLIAKGGWTSVKESASSSGASQEAMVAGAKYIPGADVRLGIGLGGSTGGRRRNQFTITLDAKVVSAPVTEVKQSGGTAGASQSVNIGNRVIGIAPMLFFGYDGK
ncbi:MAG: hypothetical protein HY903_19775 [Deltaproteobacteria bacterium]|nr:hypothetical protein [Deltaproteobacteria bacterium]